MAFDLDGYLARIGLARPPAATDEGLRALHLAHALSIPFENCDVLLRRPIKLDADSLFDKLVRRGRGGYCFEQNGLYLLALQALGIRARPLLARVSADRGWTARTHEVVLAELSGREWLCDVGFGGTGLRTPLPLEPGREDRQLHATFCLRVDPDWGTVLVRRGSHGEENQYAFTRDAVLPADLELGNHYTSTHSSQHFTQRFSCALQTESGRVTLNDLLLTHHHHGEARVVELEYGPALLRALEHDLRIKPDEGFARFLRPLTA